MTPPVDVTVSRPMRSSREAIWAVLSDLGRLPEWLAFARQVEGVSPGPIAVGSTYTVRPPGRFEPTTHWRVSEVDEPSLQLHESQMPLLANVTSRLQLDEGPDGAVRPRALARRAGEPARPPDAADVPAAHRPELGALAGRARRRRRAALTARQRAPRAAEA